MSKHQYRVTYCCRKTSTSSHNIPCDGCDNNCSHIKVIRKRSRISRGLRKRIYQRDNYCCVSCGADLSDMKQISIDHLIPIDVGGTDDEWNLATMCRKCNKIKGNKLMLKFQKLAYGLKLSSKYVVSRSNKRVA